MYTEVVSDVGSVSDAKINIASLTALSSCRDNGLSSERITSGTLFERTVTMAIESSQMMVGCFVSMICSSHGRPRYARATTLLYFSTAFLGPLHLMIYIIQHKNLVSSLC